MGCCFDKSSGKNELNTESIKEEMENNKNENTQSKEKSAKALGKIINAIEKKKIKINKEYPKLILDEINKARKDPQSLIPKLNALIPHIKKQDSKIYYINPNQPKILMDRGVEAIEKCIEFLKQCTPMQKLILMEDLEIQIPDVNGMTIMLEYENLFRSMVDQKLKLLYKSTYEYYTCHWDYGVTDPETALLFMIIDDNKLNQVRRTNILNPHLKRVWIQYKLIEKKFYSFFNFCG